MCRCFEADAAAGVDQELAGGKDPITIPGLGAVQKQVPLYHQERNVEGIEEWKRGQSSFKVCIHKSEVGAHWPVPVLPMHLSRMPTEGKRRTVIQSKKEVILDRERSTRRSAFYYPIQSGSTISRY